MKKQQNKTTKGNKETNSKAEIDQKVLSHSEAKSSVQITLPFASDAFKEAWSNWLRYLKQIKKPYKSNMSIQQIFKKLAKFDEVFVIEEPIEKSIANGWQGLVYGKTQERYEQWCRAQNQAVTNPGAKSSVCSPVGTGTRAKFKKDLIVIT